MNLQIDRPEQKARLESLSNSAAGAVATADIADSAVTTAKIADVAVTAAKIGAAAVTTAKINAGAVTPAKMDFTGIKVLRGVGHNGAGAITLTGTVVGDRLIAVFGAPTAGGALAAKVPGTDFEATVTVVDQIQQSVATDLSANNYIFILIPAAS